MAKSSAEYYEVRWRVSGSDEAWSAPQRVAPAHEIVVEDLDRTKTYEFEVRAISACGAKSDWVSGTHTVPDVPAGNLRLDEIKTEVDNAAADALAANQELANIASDNILSQGEKPVVIRDTNVITTEQAGIDAQATAFGVTTEKTAYDSAVTALTTYLATLTTPVLWSDLSGDTTIVGATFRSKFADVYTKRQALLNAIYAAAKAKADNAQSTANDATDLVSQQPVLDPNFVKGLTYWVPDGANQGWYAETGGNSPNPKVSTYAVHAGSTITALNPSADADTALRSTTYAPVTQGRVVAASAQIKCLGANGRAYVRLSWRNSSQAEIATSDGNDASTSSGVVSTSRVSAVAPAGAVYVHVEVVVIGHTAGYWTYNSVTCSDLPSTLDDVPDSGTYAKQTVRVQELLDNPDFEVSSTIIPPPGWALVGAPTASYFTFSPYAGSRSLHLACTAQFQGVRISRTLPVTPGEKYLLQAPCFQQGGTSLQMGLFYLDGTGALVGSPDVIYVSDTFWNGVQSVTGTVPSGAVSMYARFVNNTAGAADIYVDNVRLWRLRSLDADIYDGATYARIKGTELSSGIHRLGIAGSGAKVGNQFNNPNSLTLNYGAVRSTTALTATSAGAVSVSAFDYYAGSASVHYNAVSNAVTGLSQGSTYFIYCRDAVPTGGTKTWLATTNVNALLQTYDDIVVAGQVTIPTSGSSGGGGGGLCVCDDMLVAEGRHAGAAEEGDLFDCMDLPRRGLEKFQRALHSVERSAVECVRLTTEHGAIWEGSASTPFDLVEGGVEWAPRMKGRQVVTDFGIEAVVRVEHIGVRPVSHIHLGGCSYAAGRDARHRVYSHNLQWKP